MPAVMPAVMILMATLNGARWLPAQLASIAAQEGADWALWVGDDGSTDATRAIVGAFAAAQGGRVRLVDGPRRGAAANFLALLTRPDLPDAPVALADQDDVWRPDKLARGLARLADGGAGPLLYGAQSRHIGPDGRPLGRSRRPLRPVTLANAVVQNMVSGHSAMLNRDALALVRAAGMPAGIAFHDWWLSLLVLAAGGRIAIDEACVLDYRQHGGNAMGAPQGPLAQLRRMRLLFGRDYAGWVAANLAALAAVPVPLTPPARALLAALAGPHGGGAGRARALARLGVHRQSQLGTLALYLAALAGRI